MRRIFLRLTDYRGDVAPLPVSKRAALAEFTKPQEQEILKELIESKLLTSSSEVKLKDGEGQGILSLGPATVELAHEALISVWPRLAEWLKQTQEVLSLYHRLREDARRWKDTATRNPRQAESELWSGSRLEQAVELRQQGEFSRLLSGLGEAESAFLDAGVELHERRSLEQDERRLRKLQALQPCGTSTLFVVGDRLYPPCW